jgi:hypothetical protein
VQSFEIGGGDGSRSFYRNTDDESASIPHDDIDPIFFLVAEM